MSCPPRSPLLTTYYRRYLGDQDSARLIRQVSRRYQVGTLQRLAQAKSRETRRAAVLALGFLADYDSNAVLGRALLDEDRLVRTLAENGIRSLWCRVGAEAQRQRLDMVLQLNSSQQYKDALRQASDLIQLAPGFAEAWNQRAIAYYSLGRYTDSIHDCRQALALNPFHFGAAGGMGQCHVQLGEFPQALECFRKALRLNPNLEGIRASVTYLERTLRGK